MAVRNYAAIARRYAEAVVGGIFLTPAGAFGFKR